ncbi:hypothetical protein GC722_03910 [Auraticoccus sp. F435]|uniref:Uncharacterized protein n=1 Tax=Auraticoccus cholistanensis TaxID=2656650 RepID=A0A6A9URJ0_9ACTN|nr:hypothetical protein [Auraticoccus cholistanensis]MVA75178.1 hypothetical protein [Auraticoccus cholistanensis]
MSDNTGERPPMISQVPWGGGRPDATSPQTPLTDRGEGSPVGDEATRRVTRVPAGGPTPASASTPERVDPARPASGPTGWAPAGGGPDGPVPAPSDLPARSALSSPSAPSGSQSRPVPLGSPPPHRVPGPLAGPQSQSSAPSAPSQRPPLHGDAPQPPAGPGAQPAPAGAPSQGPREGAGLGGVSVPQPSRSGEGPGYPPRYGVNDLIQQLNPETQVRSRKGWRARFGLKPSQRELAELRDDESVRMPFARPVTVMVANPKGGVGKTPTTLLLAAAMGVARGGGVIAWDNNELRGTMPDRSLSPHRRTVRDMLAESDFLSQPSAQFTDLSYYLNHQTTGKFHTLGSAQTSGHVISRDDFEKIHNILARFFQVIIVDTGNNEASPNWQAAAEEADCLVVPTKWRKDSLIPAARMLETLQELNSDLLNRTVVVATNGPADSQASVRLSGAGFFGSYPIVEIPTDPHIAEGGVIDYVRLQEGTRRAALALAAEVARSIEPVAGLNQGRNASGPRRSL